MLTCFYCGDMQHKLTKDHVIPVSLAKRNLRHSYVKACRECNQFRGNADQKDFRQIIINPEQRLQVNTYIKTLFEDKKIKENKKANNLNHSTIKSIIFHIMAGYIYQDKKSFLKWFIKRDAKNAYSKETRHSYWEIYVYIQNVIISERTLFNLSQLIGKPTGL